MSDMIKAKKTHRHPFLAVRINIIYNVLSINSGRGLYKLYALTEAVILP